ncbi:acyl-CoA dehydrogenase family protein, partial [Bacillus licheniformis]
IRDLVARFVKYELIPLEAAVMAREADGQRFGLLVDERAHLDERSRQLGLWGLDAPLDVGGSDLPAVAMVGVNEAIGTTVTPYILPPDSPNLRMLCDAADDAQRARYLDPYARGATRAAMAISEPGAGSDPGALSTTAVHDGDGWVLNGRKIW